MDCRRGAGDNLRRRLEAVGLQIESVPYLRVCARQRSLWCGLGCCFLKVVVYKSCCEPAISVHPSINPIISFQVAFLFSPCPVISITLLPAIPLSESYFLIPVFL